MNICIPRFVRKNKFLFGVILNLFAKLRILRTQIFPITVSLHLRRKEKHFLGKIMEK